MLHRESRPARSGIKLTAWLTAMALNHGEDLPHERLPCRPASRSGQWAVVQGGAWKRGSKGGVPGAAAARAKTMLTRRKGTKYRKRLGRIHSARGEASSSAQLSILHRSERARELWGACGSAFFCGRRAAGVFSDGWTGPWTVTVHEALLLCLLPAVQ